MKTRIQILLFLFLNIYLQAQFVPQPIEFEAHTPNWVYYSQDTNATPSDIAPNYNPYSSHLPISQIYGNQYLYILEASRTPSPYSGQDGCLIHKLDINDGSLQWIYINNQFTGLKNREDYLGSSFTLDENDKLKLYGLKDINPIDTTSPKFSLNGHVVKRVINSNDGSLLIEDYGNDSIEEANFINGNNYGQQFIIDEADNVKRIVKQPIIDNGILKDDILLVNIDEELNYDTTATVLLRNDTGISTQDINLSYYPSIRTYTENSMLALMGSKNLENDQESPSKLDLYWLNYKDNMHIERSVSVRDYMIFPQDYVWPVDLATVDKQVVLSQLVINDNPKFWFLWLDENGNEKFYRQSLGYDGRGYVDIDLIRSYDDKLYLIGRHYNNNKFEFDLLEINATTNDVRLITTFSPILREDELIQVLNPILVDNQLIMCMYVNTSFDGIPTIYTMYLSFTVSDEGLLSSIQESQKEDMVVRLQNPTFGNFDLTVLNMIGSSRYMVNIYSLNISLVNTGVLDENGKYQADLSHLPAGLYPYTITHEGRVVYSGKWVKE